MDGRRLVVGAGWSGMHIMAVSARQGAHTILMSRPAVLKQTGGKPIIMIQLGMRRAMSIGTMIGRLTAGIHSQRLALMCGRLRLFGCMHEPISTVERFPLRQVAQSRTRVSKHFPTTHRGGTSTARWSLSCSPTRVVSRPSRPRPFILAPTCWRCRSATTMFR